MSIVDNRKVYDKISKEGETMEKPIHLPRWEELPVIDLYIDQVVTLLEEWLDFIPHSDEKLITKSMINNYVKHGIVEAPKKRRYTTTHLAYLIVVCIFKQVYSMNEITQMIRLQVHAYPIEQAYNYYIEDLEACILSIYNGEAVTHQKVDTDDPLTKILHSVNESLVNKFNVQRLIKEVKEKDVE